MIKNYFKIAYRNLLNKKGYLIINVGGLGIGMMCCLLIFQFVAFEYSFDNFHENTREIYRVLQEQVRLGDKVNQGHGFTAQAFAPALKESVAEIVEITRVGDEEAIVINPEQPSKVFESNSILYADPGFLRIFSFPLSSGTIANPLTPGTAFISESAALQYFGTIDATGKVLEVTGQLKQTYTVSGVLKNVPSNSHLQFDILLPIQGLLEGENYSKEPEGGWSWNNFATYILVRPDADLSAIEKKMTDVYLRYRGDALKKDGSIAIVHAQPLADVHLNAETQGAITSVTGSYRTVYFFMVVGIITLIIALVNYVNLSTSQSVNRSLEVGVRKVSGARRRQLVTQFLTESALTNLLAAALAFVLASTLIPYVNELAEISLSSLLWTNPGFWPAFSVVLVSGTLLAGLYPAFVLSSFKPASILKGRGVVMNSHQLLRKSLVVLQFAASVILIAGTAIVYNQLNYMRSMDIGLDLDQILTVKAPRVLPDNTTRRAAMASFVQRVKTNPEVQQAALSSSVPGKGFNWNGAAIRKAEDDPAKAIRGVATYVDTTFSKVYGFELVAGRDFSSLLTDSNEKDAPWRVIVNESTAKSLGFATPADAVEHDLDIGGYRARIMGVVKDFNWSSAHQQTQNMVFGLTTGGQYISIKVAGADASKVIADVQKAYNELFPSNVFSYQFADQAFEDQYRNEQRFAKLFTIAAGMTIFITCMGLFGLVAFTAQQRAKEIGMRKVLGASVPNIVAMLSKDFLWLVLLGFVVAVPVTWYYMNEWLANFAYKTEIGFSIFAIAGALTILISLVTVSVQALKAALANPVKSLRND
jgi:putative ABC transport system permease protein